MDTETKEFIAIVVGILGTIAVALFSLYAFTWGTTSGSLTELSEGDGSLIVKVTIDSGYYANSTRVAELENVELHGAEPKLGRHCKTVDYTAWWKNDRLTCYKRTIPPEEIS